MTATNNRVLFDLLERGTKSALLSVVCSELDFSQLGTGKISQRTLKYKKSVPHSLPHPLTAVVFLSVCTVGVLPLSGVADVDMMD